MCLGERIVGGLELRELCMLVAAVFGKLFSFLEELCGGSVGFGLGELELLGQSVDFELNII